MSNIEVSHVTHIITSLDRGGAEKQLLILCEEQSKLGLICNVIYLKGQGELVKEFEKFGIKVEKLTSIGEFVSMYRTIRSNGKLLIHSHLPRAEILGLLMVIFTPITFVVSRHNAEAFYKSAPKKISVFLSRAILKRANKVIAISQAVKKYLLDHDEIADKDVTKIEVVYYGYDAKAVPSKMEKVNTYPDKFNAGTISRLVEQKDLITLISGFEKFHRECPESQLTIVGEGEERTNLSKVILERGLSESVKLLGRSKEVIEYLCSLDVFILSSKYEGFGLVLLEAMQCNVPILCTDVSAIPEVVGGNYPGLFQVGNSGQLSELLGNCLNPKFTDLLTSEYRLRLAIFEPEQMARNVVSLYRQ
jgi:glycosyltransferase involved in cell wall biosynthesis